MQAGTASADSGKAKVTGVYSDLTYHEESGDILGDEVFLVSSNKGYFGVFQGSEGEPYPPWLSPPGSMALPSNLYFLRKSTREVSSKEP
jgi:hypothetical protein